MKLAAETVANCGGGHESVMVRVNVLLTSTELASVTWTVKVQVPVSIGVPLIPPVLDSTSPAGKAPATSDHRYEVVPPDAASVWQYGIPAIPVGSDSVAMAIGRVDVVRVTPANPS
jgi:hypothetical protein